MIGILQKGVADEQLPYFAQSSGLTVEESASLLDRLAPVLSNQFNVEAKQSREFQKLAANELDADFIQNSFAELVRAEANLNASGATVLAMRANRSIYVDSFGKTGLALTRVLAASGIGRVVSHDSRPILPADIGADGFEQSHQGQSRFTTVSQILARNHLHTRVSNANRMGDATLSQLDCAVLISQSVTAPARYATWARKQIPHLNITFSEQFIDVSPVILAGKNPCLKCLDLNRMSIDSAWPALASQILASNLRFDDSSSRAFAVGLAAKSILLQLDSSLFAERHLGQPGEVQSGEPGEQRSGNNEVSLATTQGFRLDLAAHRVHEFSWPTSINCGCRQSEG